MSTVIAETSVTVEDVVFVIDPGRTKLTCLNETSLVSALRTGWRVALTLILTLTLAS